MLVIDSNTEGFTLVLSQYKSCSVAAARCKVAVCEAQCVVGSVIRPVDPSLPPTYTHSEVCGHTAGPVWPTTPTSPLPLSGWDDRHRELGEEKGGGGPPLVALQMWPVCLAGMYCTYSRQIERHLDKQGGCVYVSQNEPLSHMAPLWPLDHSGPVPRQLVCSSPVRTHTSTQLFIQSEVCCPLISLSVRTVCS